MQKSKISRIVRNGSERRNESAENKQMSKTLCGGLTVKVLINGHLSKIIDTLRGVKQGDTLSCEIFIICIDPS